MNYGDILDGPPDHNKEHISLLCDFSDWKSIFYIQSMIPPAHRSSPCYNIDHSIWKYHHRPTVLFSSLNHIWTHNPYICPQIILDNVCWKYEKEHMNLQYIPPTLKPKTIFIYLC